MIIGGIALVLVIMVAGYFVGNFIKADSSNYSDQKAASAEDYITLGEYKGIEVDKKQVSLNDITDEMVQDEIDFLMEDYREYKEVTDRAVEEGDLINFDFEGEINGEKPEDMASEGFELYVGEGEFIEELEAGLVGLEVGQEEKIEITFPEDYGEGYAGEKAVFTVKVNSIKESSELPELTDEFVKTNLGYKSIEDMKTSLKAELLQYDVESSEEQIYTDIMEKIMSNSKLGEYPQEVYDEAYSEMRAEMEQGASMFGMSFEEYLELMGESEDIPQQWVEERVLENGITELIIAKEKIKLSDKEYKQMIEDNLDVLGMDTAEEVEEQYQKEELTDYFLALKLQEFLIEKAKINEIPAAEYDEKYNEESVEE